MEQYSDKFQLRIYYEDTDAGGIVYYANYLKYLERARTEFLRAKGINQSTFLEQKLGFVVTKVEMDNVAPAKLDDLLTVSSGISQLKGASVVFVQVIHNQAGTLICKATIKVACVNFVETKACPIPKSIKGALKRDS